MLGAVWPQQKCTHRIPTKRQEDRWELDGCLHTSTIWVVKSYLRRVRFIVAQHTLFRSFLMVKKTTKRTALSFAGEPNTTLPSRLLSNLSYYLPPFLSRLACLMASFTLLASTLASSFARFTWSFLLSCFCGACCCRLGVGGRMWTGVPAPFWR